MKLTSKIQIGFTLPALFIVCMGLGSIYGFWRINEQVGTIYDDRLVPLKQLKEISDDYAVLIIDAVNKGNEGQISPNEALASIQKAQERIKNNWETYRQTYLTAEEQTLAWEVEELFKDADEQINQLIRVLEEKQFERIDEFDGALYAVIEPVSAKIQELIDLQLEIAQNERREAENIYYTILWIFIPAMIAAVILVILPIRLFISRLIIGTLKETINTIASASTEIAASAEQQERLAAQESASVNETTTTMEQLKSSAQQSTLQAQTAATAAEQVLQLSYAGNIAVGETLAGMSDLQEKVGGITVALSQLNEQITQINSYQQLVSEIAKQTNMLALNAAVEAVRAGEHGKGFAVVATEIRKLADQSKEQGQKINEVVGAIQAALKTTVKATESGTKTVEEEVKIAQKTADTFQSVAEAIGEVSVSVQQISLNTKQQAVAIGEVVNAMSILKQAATETASGINQTKVGTQKLSETSMKLKSMV
ncbi:MAG: MCP four helix bundle domain-containing protein [Gomphosphaeria aponina SAG 52.96 = DSM 107014]|uniref:MCP four helix bundle domain-containing protein n=1 Tax=Gomphosphaeria aponina SAG 52.96 = DSM 107014 TaxID=1521640 RepID=A0A941GW10_9CHRO|nr:MCP four helix bundle domain-containing protein [Gomphosphaeria aponina SAG 52.96 = DSM 107014]